MKKIILYSLIFSIYFSPLPASVNYTQQSLHYINVFGGPSDGLALALINAKCHMIADKIVETEDRAKQEQLKINLEIEVDSLVDAIECLIQKISAHNAFIEEAMQETAESGRDNLLLARQREKNKAQLAKNNENLAQLPLIIEELKELLETAEDF